MVVARSDRAGLIEAVSGEGWPIDLSAAVLDDTGWENSVLTTPDGWIMRFPRSASVPFEREVALLGRLYGRLPVPIPNLVWVGQRVRVAIYRRLTGAAFDPAAYRDAPTPVRDRLADSLAAFLAAMHGASHDNAVAALAVPDVDHAAIHRLVVDRLGRLGAAHRAGVARLAERYEETWVHGAVPGPRVLLHNDFHPLNMVLSGPVGVLTGVWDFSSVLVDVPTFELRYFDAGPRDLLHRLAGAYTARTGRTIHVPAAILANRMENVYDALLTGRMELFAQALALWAAADADC